MKFCNSRERQHRERHRRPFSITLINPKPYITEEISRKYPQNVSVMYLIMSLYKKYTASGTTTELRKKRNCIRHNSHSVNEKRTEQNRDEEQKRAPTKKRHDPHQPYCNSHKHCWFEMESIAFGWQNKRNQRRTHRANGTEWWIFVHTSIVGREREYTKPFGHILYWVHVDINRARVT